MAGPPTGGEGGAGRPFRQFDPVVGMRVMADIQAEGLRAASELLERVLRSEPDGNGRAPSQDGDYTTLVDEWTDLLRRTAAGLAQPGGPDAVTVSLEASALGPPVRIVAEGSSREAAAEVWLHNGTSSDVGPLFLHCGELRDADGKKLKGAKVRFKPRELKLLPARSSRAVVVKLVPKDAPRPGVYRGTIQAQGAPNLWLPLEVAIEPC